MRFEHPSPAAVHQLVCVPGPWWGLRSVRYVRVDFVRKVGYTHAGDPSRPWATLRPGQGADTAHMLSPVQLFCLPAPARTPCMCKQALFRKEPNWNFSSGGRFTRRRGPFLPFLRRGDLTMLMTHHPRRCGVYPGPTRHLYRCLGIFVSLGQKPPLGPGRHRNVHYPR